MKILLLTTHLYDSKHRAGFRHIADSLLQMGHEVSFCTVPNTLISLFRDFREGWYALKLRIRSFSYAFAPRRTGSLTITSYLSLVHNYSHAKYFGRLKRFLFRWGFCRVFRKETFDLIVFESSVSLFLFQGLKRLHPRAITLYRVSDSLRFLQADCLLVEEEQRLFPLFDRICVPNAHMADEIKRLNPGVQIDMVPHGVDKRSLSQAIRSPSPFQTERNFVFVGMWLFDHHFLEIASRVRPDCHFHLIGRISGPKVRRSNVIYYGVLPFQETLLYIAHADVCLHTVCAIGEFQLMGHALKFHQYTYFKKPILAPEEMQLRYPHVFSYQRSESSIHKAIEDALKKQSVDFSGIELLDWQEITARLLQNLQTLLKASP